MKLHELMDIALLDDMIDQGFIRERRHPTLPYRILGYTETAQYSRTWNAATRQCRGLVVDDENVVIARSFSKFFNDSEHDGERLPLLDLSAPVEVTDKLDGSLGISVPTPDGLVIATRGSFESDQAKWATEFYRQHYTDRFQPVDGCTYLWEIIWRENRIVVQYDFEDLVLLGAIDNETGAVISAAEIAWPGRKAKQFPYRTLAEALAAPVRDNAEGFVIRFLDSDLMVKCKLERYVQLHKIITGLSEKSVWEHASAGKPFEELIADLPDEFHEWVTGVWNELMFRHGEMRAAARLVFQQLVRDDTRKDFALRVQQHPNMETRPFMFMLYDGNTAKFEAAIWKAQKPSGDTYMMDTEAAA